MEESEIIEIEDRLSAYPVQAQQDIRQLTRELRRLGTASKAKRPQHSASHLYDALTGLLNAAAYGVRFAMARARATRYRKIFAVMSVDVVRAPGRQAARVNASARDQTIKHIAEQLEACVRATDTLARIGNENFAIILEDLSEPGHAERVKQHVQEALGDAAAGGSGAPEVDIRLDFYPGPRQTPAEVVYSS